jgi:hypothetical protein
MILDLNLTDLGVYMLLLATFVVLALYWMISLFLTVIRAPNGGISLLDHRSFFQFIVVNLLLVINSVMFYLFSRWPFSHPGRAPFERDDLYPFAWLPLNLFLIVGIGEVAYRKFSNAKNLRSIFDVFRDGVEKWNSTT